LGWKSIPYDTQVSASERELRRAAANKALSLDGDMMEQCQIYDRLGRRRGEQTTDDGERLDDKDRNVGLERADKTY
jgi:hypothetical protein